MSYLPIEILISAAEPSKADNGSANIIGGK
jgi:hypothetical protein